MSSTRATLRSAVLAAIAPLADIAPGDPGALPVPCVIQPGNTAQAFVRHADRDRALVTVTPGTLTRTRNAKNQWQIDAVVTLMLYAPAGREDLATLDAIDETIERLVDAARARSAVAPWQSVDAVEDPDFDDAALQQMRAGVKFAVLTFRATEIES